LKRATARPNASVESGAANDAHANNKEEETKAEEGHKLYLSGEEAAQLARAGVAFDTSKKESATVTSKSEDLEKEIKEAKALAEESEKALNRVSPEVTKFISDVAEEYEKNPDNDKNDNNK